MPLTVGLNWERDQLLALQQAVLPANAFFPGSPATTVFANRENTTQLTTGGQISY